MPENVSPEAAVKTQVRRGRPKGSKDKNPGSRPSTVGKKGTFSLETYQPKDPGKTSQFIRFAMAGLDLPPIDISDPQQVENRIRYYFHRCAEEEHRPGVVGLCNYLGIDRSTFNQWVNGNYRAGTHYDIAKKAYDILESMWEDYALNGQVNPVTLIFLGKNHFGYQDRTEVVQVQKDPLAEGSSPSEIASRYAQAVVAEDPEPLPIGAESSAETAEEAENLSAERAEEP